MAEANSIPGAFNPDERRWQPRHLARAVRRRPVDVQHRDDLQEDLCGAWHAGVMPASAAQPGLWNPHATVPGLPWRALFACSCLFHMWHALACAAVLLPEAKVLRERCAAARKLADALRSALPTVRGEGRRRGAEQVRPPSPRRRLCQCADPFIVPSTPNALVLPWSGPQGCPCSSVWLQCDARSRMHDHTSWAVATPRCSSPWRSCSSCSSRRARCG